MHSIVLTGYVHVKFFKAWWKYGSIKHIAQDIQAVVKKVFISMMIIACFMLISLQTHGNKIGG